MDLHQCRVSLSVWRWCFILCRMLSHQQKGFIAQSLPFLQAAMTQKPMLLYLRFHALPVNFFFCGWSTSSVKASLELNVYRINHTCRHFQSMLYIPAILVGSFWWVLECNNSSAFSWPSGVKDEVLFIHMHLTFSIKVQGKSSWLLTWKDSRQGQAR